MWLISATFRKNTNSHVLKWNIPKICHVILFHCTPHKVPRQSEAGTFTIQGKLRLWICSICNCPLQGFVPEWSKFILRTVTPIMPILTFSCYLHIHQILYIHIRVIISFHCLNKPSIFWFLCNIIYDMEERKSFVREYWVLSFIHLFFVNPY